MKIKNIKSIDDAIKALSGCKDIIIDVKSKMMYWTIGMEVSKKIVHAGSIIDGIVENNKRVWNTIWMHSDTCSCRGCVVDHNTSKVSFVRRAHPRKVPTV